MKMAGKKLELAGTMVALPVKNEEIVLDGFWRHEAKLNKTLMIFLHGMHSNFYRSKLKKMLMSRCVEEGCDLLTFNNRGCESGVAYERFKDCLADIDTMLAFGKSKGYRQFILIGHSTGCQKITYYQAVRQDKRIVALINLAPGDDYAIWRREAGSKANYWLKKAHQLVRDRKGDTLLPSICLGFSARRFLSVADPAQLESKIFNYAGSLTHFRKVRCPVLVLFGSEEQYACIPVEEMGAILEKKSRSVRYTYHTITGADHSFHEKEAQTSRVVFRWLGGL